METKLLEIERRVNMTWNKLKRLGWALMIFVVGVSVGGTFPVWVKLVVPCAAVAWLIAYDELAPERMQRKAIRNYYKNPENYRDYGQQEGE